MKWSRFPKLDYAARNLHYNPIMISFSRILLLLVMTTSVQVYGRTIKARLVYFSPSAEDPAALFVSGTTPEKVVKLDPTSSVAPPPVSLPVGDDGKVIFAKSQSRADVIATAVVPAGVSQAVFFFIKAPGAGSTYAVLVVDESAQALPGGGSFICNIAPQTARVSIGELNYEFPGGKSTHLKRPKTDAQNMAPFRVTVNMDGTWTSIKDSTLRFAENERYFLIIYPEGVSGPNIKIYKQAVTEPRPAQ